jgi:hypothetical protein
VRGHRGDPDREGGDRADDRRERDLDAADANVRRRPVRARELGLAVAEPDHGQLGRRERRQDAEAEEAGEERHVVLDERGADHERRRDERRGDDRLRRYERAPVQTPERARELAVLAERAGEAREARHRGRDGDQQDDRARETDVHAERGVETAGEVLAERVDDPHQRRSQPVRSEPRGASLRREGRERDERDRDVDHDDEPDPREEAARKVASRLPGLLCQVRNGLEACVGQHRERQREGDLVPGGVRADRDPVRERLAGEEEREPELATSAVKVEDRDDDP